MRKTPRTKVGDRGYRKYMKGLLQGQLARNQKKVPTYKKTRFGVRNLKTKALAPPDP